MRSLRFSLLSCLILVPGICQTTHQVAPIPADPLELATGPVQVAETPEQRASVLALLERARQSYKLRTPGSVPFHLKVSFVSSGATTFTGPGEMEETWIRDSLSRWTARLGSYSQTRIFNEGPAYDVNPHVYMPMRLQMLRSAIYWPVQGNFANVALRVASANWNGTSVTCILTAAREGQDASIPGRRWYEEEYCIDPKSGLLQTYSIAPGMYAVYDYANGISFHGRVLPRQISILIAGTPVLQAQMDVMDVASVDSSAFTPTPEMQAPGAVIRGPMRFGQFIPSASASGSTAIQPVIVHAVLDPEGKVLEAEALQTSDAALSQTALEVVKSSNYARAAFNYPTQREVFINVQFRPPKSSN